MKKQICQFDTGKLTESVATPTCSSCCCCCCCLTTAITSSRLLTHRIALETKNKKIASRTSLLIASALFIPFSILVGYFGFWTINLLSECTTKSYTGYGASASTYQVCTNPAANLIWPIIIMSPLIVLAYLYTRAKISHPWKRAILATLLISIATAIEFVGGAFLILTTGGLLYIILIPLFYGLIVKIYKSSWLSKPLNVN